MRPALRRLSNSRGFDRDKPRENGSKSVRITKRRPEFYGQPVDESRRISILNFRIPCPAPASDIESGPVSSE